MSVVTLSSKFQIVISKEVREKAKLTAGTKLEVISFGGRIELIPVGPIKKLRGILKDMDTKIEREN